MSAFIIGKVLTNPSRYGLVSRHRRSYVHHTCCRTCRASFHSEPLTSFLVHLSRVRVIKCPWKMGLQGNFNQLVEIFARRRLSFAFWLAQFSLSQSLPCLHWPHLYLNLGYYQDLSDIVDPRSHHRPKLLDAVLDLPAEVRTSFFT